MDPTLILGLFLIKLTIFIYLYMRLKNHFNYWNKKKVPYLKPKSYILGEDFDTVTGKLSFPENIQRIYTNLVPHKYGGIFSFTHPILIVRDPELIKKILAKDFSHFYDRSPYFTDKNDTLTLHLFNLTGEEWKTLRSKMTPTFTSGKIKMMLPLVKECSDELMQVMQEKCIKKEDVEMKDMIARYSNDVISSCAFGLRTDSLKNPECEFRRVMQKILTPTIRTRVRDLLFAINPKFTQFIGLKNFDKEVTHFMKKIVGEMVEYRKENSITRNDFLDLLIKLQNEDEIKVNLENQKSASKSLKFTLDILIAQCFIFFVAGFETSSSAVSFALFELAKNPVIQRKLQQEIDSVLKKYNGEMTYESLQEMHYTEQVIFETMRLYPALSFLMRACTSNYELSESDIFIEKGTSVFIPVYGLHRDSTYFPNPNEFNPDNFSEEAKATRPDYVYLPFGDGPRICIGMRFGMMQVKLALVTLLKNFNFSISPKMQLPLKYVKYSILTNSDGGIWLNCIERDLQRNFLISYSSNIN